MPCLYPILTLWLVQLFLPFLAGVPGASLLTFTRASRDATAFVALFSPFPIKLLPSRSQKASALDKSLLWRSFLLE